MKDISYMSAIVEKIERKESANLWEIESDRLSVANENGLNDRRPNHGTPSPHGTSPGRVRDRARSTLLSLGSGCIPPPIGLHVHPAVSIRPRATRRYSAPYCGQNHPQNAFSSRFLAHGIRLTDLDPPRAYPGADNDNLRRVGSSRENKTIYLRKMSGIML